MHPFADFFADRLGFGRDFEIYRHGMSSLGFLMTGHAGWHKPATCQRQRQTKFEAATTVGVPRTSRPLGSIAAVCGILVWGMVKRNRCQVIAIISLFDGGRHLLVSTSRRLRVRAEGRAQGAPQIERNGPAPRPAPAPAPRARAHTRARRRHGD